ncbi:3-oxo-5-alpha-steroid 4-dehydrogenase 1 isoform X1 [Gallus gallus]|uniref:3-oxo-5-alpha-steroid 4-dehydrogenase 1 isoform X1 n=1 Tax=Gallus gallus TaxID=9031 RepID=UPI001AEAAA2E|nr:3-oxo-5-alpha-steroid 4-dehydrogenase 1 isoform X1 [Gallus gallus]
MASRRLPTPAVGAAAPVSLSDESVGQRARHAPHVHARPRAARMRGLHPRRSFRAALPPAHFRSWNHHAVDPGTSTNPRPAGGGRLRPPAPIGPRRRRACREIPDGWRRLRASRLCWAQRGMAGGGGFCAFWQRAAGPREQRLLELLSYGLVALGAVSALLLRFIPMPYGRYSSRRFGWLLPARPAWLLQELPALLVPLALAACIPVWRLPNAVLLGCFILHYVHRCGRSGRLSGVLRAIGSRRALIFPFLIRQGKPTPFFTFLLALLFCIYNGYLQGRSLSTYAEYPSDWLKHPCFIAGFMGWLIGMAINIHSDHILRNLRKPGETGYKIPRGGMFEYVSGANFFGEILEWFGFALACCTTESLAFALCTLFILGSRAKQHHQWYLEKFEDYPKNRKIVIPFVY